VRVYLSHSTLAFPGYFGDRALAALHEHAEVVRNLTDRELRDTELAEAAAGCGAIIAYRGSPGTAASFAAAPDLVAFLRCAVDISTVDVAAASGHGILVTCATPGFVDAVAELGLGMMVDLARGVSRAVQSYRAGTVPEARPGLQLSGATLGLLGYGRIARRLAEIARAMGMRVLAHDPHVPEATATMAEALGGADIVVCLALSTPETRHLMGARAFAAMRRGALFVNLSRGEVVDEAALTDTLERRAIAGAGLDVYEKEPFVPERLRALDNCVLLPHLGSATVETRQAMAQMALDNIIAWDQGRPPPQSV